MTSLRPGDLQGLADIARLAAGAGARVAMHWWRRQGELAVSTKDGPDDLVSQADPAAEAAIRAAIADRRPDDAIRGEELHPTPGRSGVVWVIDPIDGTTSFLYGRDDWSVSVAALDARDGRILAGAVCEPVGGLSAWAAAGSGCYLDGRPVRIRPIAELGRALVEVNLGRPSQRGLAGAMVSALVEATRDLRRGGSAAAALAHLATGRADAVWAPGIRDWDGAAGVLLAHEAGAMVGDLNGSLALRWPPTGDVLAADPALWPVLAGLLRPIYLPLREPQPQATGTAGSHTAASAP